MNVQRPNGLSGRERQAAEVVMTPALSAIPRASAFRVRSVQDGLGKSPSDADRTSMRHQCAAEVASDGQDER